MIEVDVTLPAAAIPPGIALAETNTHVELVRQVPVNGVGRQYIRVIDSDDRDAFETVARGPGGDAACSRRSGDDPALSDRMAQPAAVSGRLSPRSPRRTDGRDARRLDLPPPCRRQRGPPGAPARVSGPRSELRRSPPGPIGDRCRPGDRPTRTDGETARSPYYRDRRRFFRDSARNGACRPRRRSRYLRSDGIRPPTPCAQ